MLRAGRGGSANSGLPSYGGAAPSYGGYNGNGSAYGGFHGGGGGSNGSFKDKPRSRNGSNDPVALVLDKLKQPWMWGVLAASFFFILTMQYRSQRNAILRELNVSSTKEALQRFQDTHSQKQNFERELFSKTSETKTTAQKTAKLEVELRKVQKERDELRVKFESPDRRRDEIRLAAREEAWKKQVQVLQQATSKESRRAVMEKFGAGPHFVQLTVVLPYDETETPKNFVVEMAPLESVPHAVHLFLEQVAHGLWSSAWFYLNGPHVLQGGPQAEDDEEGYDEAEDEREFALRKFRSLNLESLAFPEYSEDFPHVPWTLGYTGRPGGPDWYINKVDNTKSHGPGGQNQHDLNEFADPCFGKVVDGFDVLQEVIASPTVRDDPEWQWFYEEPVHIIGAKILDGPPENLRSKQEPKKEQPDKPALGIDTKPVEGRPQKMHKPRMKHKPLLDHQVAP
jgi:cyclophilin family peptidyl-prolyl cis-trans isomerase